MIMRISLMYFAAILVALVPTLAAAGRIDEGAKDVADIVRWHDSLPKAFKKGGADPIISFWAPTYKEVLVDTDGSKKVTVRKDAVAMLMAQMRYKGSSRDSNGPGAVYLKSVEVSEKQVTLMGFWYGSWREGTPDSLKDQGMSFEDTFMAIWKKAGSTWLLDSFTETIPTAEMSEADFDAYKAAHEKIKKQYLRE